MHALEILHGLLRPGGVLIDIHPSGEPPSIELACGGQRRVAGYIQETDNFIEYTQADTAIAQAVAQGWFSIEREDTFEFFVRTATIAEMRDFLEHNYNDAILAPEIDQKIEEWLGSLDTMDIAEIRLVEMREQVKITRFKSES